MYLTIKKFTCRYPPTAVLLSRKGSGGQVPWVRRKTVRRRSEDIVEERCALSTAEGKTQVIYLPGATSIPTRSGSLSLVGSQLFSKLSRAVSVVVVGENGSNVYRGVSCNLKDVVIVDRRVPILFFFLVSSSCIPSGIPYNRIRPSNQKLFHLLDQFVLNGSWPVSWFTFSRMLDSLEDDDDYLLLSILARCGAVWGERNTNQSGI